MERYLSNLNIWGWTYADEDRSYRGLHITADVSACDALIRCIDSFGQVGPGHHRTIPLKTLAPSDEKHIRGGTRYRSFKILRIEFVEQSPTLQQMFIGGMEECLLIRITPLRLHELRSGFEDIRRGTGDYAIFPTPNRTSGWTLGTEDRDSERLWFWPCFGHYAVTSSPSAD